MKRFRYIFFAVLLAMMWLGINVYADEYDGLDFDYGSVLVQLKPQITDAVSMCSDPFEELNISDAKCIFGDDASSISLFSDKTEPIIYVLDLGNPSRENVIDAIEKLKAMPNIEYAEPNYNVYEFSEPNDTYYQNGKQAVLDLIGAKKLWDFDIDCSDVTVGVMDSGIQTNHEDLIDNIWVNTGEIADDGIDNDQNGFVDDVNGWNFFDNSNQIYTGKEDTHGTHAAGTIAASRKGTGIAGIADNQYVKLMVLKALGTEFGVGEEEDVINAIRYAEANGAEICNLSFGTTHYYPELEKVMRESKMLFVVAAGNGDKDGNGIDIDANPDYPSCFGLDNVISVANLIFDGNLEQTSNYGANNVDIAAPGTYIVSTTADNSYGFMTGTSMAAPMVTGTAALIYSARTDLSLQDIKTAILSTVHKLAPLKGKTATGGMLDVSAAIKWTKN